MNRRDVVKAGILPFVVASCTPKLHATPSIMSTISGKVNHSACRWCYNKIPLEELCEKGKDIGLSSIELLNLEEVPTAIQYGLKCAIANGSKLGIPNGFNNPQNHAKLLEEYTYLIPRLAELGVEQVICFSGNRHGIDDETGIENCAVGLDPIVKLAQKYNMRVVMELLNSKVDHADYQCDHTEWGVALAEKMGSDHFKLLYDIYHMQIMEGDVIATIRKHAKYISHFHTGGVPGRREINETQELNYTAIVKAIVDTGFTGYIAQEFIPSREDGLVSLAEGIKICNI